MSAPMVGRKVVSVWGKVGAVGTVTQWEPNGSGMCDARVQHDDGSVCWYSSADLRPIDDLGPLPSRSEARKATDAEALRSLQVIRAQHVRDFDKPWPGAEHGKAIVGQAIDGAIAEVEARLKR